MDEVMFPYVTLAKDEPWQPGPYEGVELLELHKNEMTGVFFSLARGRLQTAKLLSGLFHKYAHVRGNGFWAEARRERRAYPAVDL